MLKEIEITGFKSIQQTKLSLNKINVLIGANGAGKSNFIDFFQLLVSLANQRLQFYIGHSGGANSLLHYGIKITLQIAAQLRIETTEGDNIYGFNLSYAPVNRMIIEESINFKPSIIGEESALIDDKVMLDHIGNYRVFHFHDTSETAQMRSSCDINNNRVLLNDASNLAAILYKLQQTQAPYYQRIIKTIRKISPFFDDFLLKPLTINPNEIQLRWRARNSDYEFGPHQLSDGTCRTIALITLLLQDEKDLPSLIILDEPELGLHPYAISLIAALIRSASIYTQIILSTQSTNFLDEFEPEDVIVVEQRQGKSLFKRLNMEQLSLWREDYTLSELWEKNVIGGSPSR